MTVQLDAFTDPPLTPADTDEEYELYRAAVDWGLASTIAIRSADDILSSDAWKDLVQPFQHQVQNLITFCRNAPVALIADEVGLGKTISAGLILSELMARKRVTRALVLCPKPLCGQWVEELSAKFRIDAGALTGAQLVDAGHGGKSVVVTNYETARGHLSSTPRGTFEMLILDEAHRLRNLHGSDKAPEVATKIRDVLEDRLFTYVLMLTATPVYNRFWDMYSLIDLLTKAKGHRNPFGDPTQFRATYLTGAEGRKLRPGSAAQFRKILSSYVARTRRVDAGLPFPTREVRLERVPLTPAERALEPLIGRLVGELNALEQTSLGQALMSSPAALAAQLEHMAAKRPHLAEIAARMRAVADGPTPPAKLDRLYAVCDTLRASRPDWRLVVFTGRQETQEMIRRGLQARGTAVGMIIGGRAEANRRDTAAFTADPPGIHVLVSTDAGAEGLNLQAANFLVNYDLPWSPMRIEQRIGRIQRLGSKYQKVVVLNLVAEKTVEEAVVARLMEKLITVTETVGDLESILAGVVSGAEDSRNERFEAMVRGLVVQSLRGQDVARAAQVQAENMERARRDYDQNTRQMNRDLGALDEIHTTGEQPPVFDRPKPSMAADEFSRRALAAKGRQPKEANGVPASPCVPGQPEFDRLVEHWAHRRSHRVFDLRPDTERDAEQIAREWCASYEGVSFLSCEVRSRKPLVNGKVLVVLTAENGVDRHQRVVDHPVAPEGHQPIPLDLITGKPGLREQVSLGDVTPHAVERVRRRIVEDEELSRFSNYYTSRRIEELSRAGENPHLVRKVENDFTVEVSAEVVGFRGARYEEVLLEIRFAVEGGEYSAVLQAVPATKQVIERPTEQRCGVTGRRMPYGVLERCVRSETMVPKHLLSNSEFSGRLALQQYFRVCQVTGQNVLDDEVFVSAVSGTVALRQEFVKCERSGDLVLKRESGTSDVSRMVVRKDLLGPSAKPPHRLGLRDEFGLCEQTGMELLVDELDKSAASGKWVDRELLVRSEMSDRRALASELVVCEVTHRQGLPDETGICALTGSRVDSRLLARSRVSGRFALKSRMVHCAVTNAEVLPGELAECAVTRQWVLPELLKTCQLSGIRALATHLEQCEQTGAWLLLEYLAVSAVSKKRVDRRLLTPSALPPRRLGLQHEFVECAATGRRLLIDEVVASPVSGRIVGRDQLVKSAASERWAVLDEMVLCEESLKPLLPDEVAQCSETNAWVDRQLLSSISPSGMLVLTRLTGVCSQTGKRVLIRDLERCSITGALAIHSELETCAVSGIRALRSQLRRCSVTGAWLRPDYTAVSAISGRVVDRRVMIQSALSSGRLGCPDEIAVCSVTGRKLLIDEVAKSDVTGRVIGRDELVKSAASERWAVLDEMVVCEETRKPLLPDEVAQCSETKAWVDRRLLSPIAASGVLVLTRLTGVCSQTGKRVLTWDLERCSLTGALAIHSELETCAVSGVRAIRSQLRQCSVTGAWLRPEYTEVSAISGRVGDRRAMIQSALSSGRLGCPDEIAVCTATGRKLLIDELATSDVSGRVVGRDRLVKSAISERFALPEEMVVCAETRVRLLPGEAVRCMETGRWVDPRLVVHVGRPPRLVLKRLTEVCSVTQVRMLLSDLQTCTLTGARAARAQLEVCAITQKRCLKSHMSRSDLSGRYGIPAESSRCPESGLLLLSDEGVRCQWSRARVVPKQTGRCDFTGIRVAQSYLNRDGQLAPLAFLLDGRFNQLSVPVYVEQQSIGPLLRLLCSLDSEFHAATDAWAVRAPDDRVLAVVVEVEVRKWFSRRTDLIGLVLREGDKPRILGTAVQGRRNGNGEFMVETTLEFS
jgi:superfamily II DNA or RNA helicase